jgi:N-acetyl-anhydromuramyl-L-alanine amidase AmpD
MVNIRKNLLPESLYDWKSPYKMNPTRIVVHNTANDASADAEIKYMNKSQQQGGVQVSYHYAVDDIEVVQGLPENRNGWHAGDGNGKGNREGIAIEICYSKSGGERFIKAEQNAVELIVDILNRYGWGIDKVTKHQDYMDKYCPHRTLDLGWDRFLKMIEDKLDNKPQPTEKKVNVYYQVETKEDGILPMVKNLEDYAGWKNHAIIYLAMKTDIGYLKYRVTTITGKVLPWVTGCNINDLVNGCAGNGEPIATVEVYYYTPDSIRPYKKAKYKVNDYAWQYDLETSNGQDGYAGVKGVVATKFQIEII